MGYLSEWREQKIRVIPALLIFAAPLIQGGTPRLATFILEILFLAMVLSALVGRCQRAFRPLPLHPLESVLYLFLFLSALNLLRVPYYHDAERCFMLIVMYAGTYSLILRLPGERPLKMLLDVVRVTALFQAVLALVQALLLHRYQPTGTFYNPNFLAGFLAVGAGLYLVDVLGMDDPEAVRRRGKAFQIYSRAALLVVILALVWTRSRGGVLALLAVTGLILVGRFRMKAFLPIGLLVLGLLVFPNPFRQRLMSLEVKDVYAYSRIDIWQSALLIFGDHPLAGVGLGQYRYFATRYAFPVKAHWAQYARMAENPHSEYLMLAAEMGAAGLVVLVLFLGVLGWSIQKRRPRPDKTDPDQPWTLLFILAGVALQAAVDFNLHSPPIVLASLVLLAAWEGGDHRAPVLTGEGQTIRRKYLLVLLPLFSLIYLFMGVRTMAGFYHFLKSGGGPVNLIDEKGSLSRWGREGGEVDIDHLRRAAFWDGDAAPYHAALGSQAARKHGAAGDPGRLEGAFQGIGTALALNPNNFRYYGHLGDLHYSLARRGEGGAGNLALAETNFRRSLDLNPFNVFIRDKLGRLLLETGRVNEASGEYRRILELEPCFLRAWFQLGLSLELLGQEEEARARYLETLEKAEKCPVEDAETPYERSLIDLDVDLIHNRLDLPGGYSPGP